MKVKDYITKVEVFAGMYTPPRSYRLFKTWEQLIQQGFDPVAEYNKAVEEYSLRYFPNARELFIILFTLSRFFMELSDLEGTRMPEYRHPLIKISKFTFLHFFLANNTHKKKLKQRLDKNKCDFRAEPKLRCKL